MVQRTSDSSTNKVLLDSSDHSEIHFYICSFINLANLASCSKDVCTGSGTAQIEKALSIK